MNTIWNTLLFQPILNILILFYNLLFSNLGLAIIFLTLIIRLILIPLTNPQLKASKKMQELMPELEKLKKKYKDDKQKLMQAQMELYKRNNINPAAGCLPWIVQLILLITLFQVFNQVIRSGTETIAVLNEKLYPFLRFSEGASLNLNFLHLNLAKPDLIQIPGFVAIPGIFVILATVFQFLSSKLMVPSVKVEEKEAKATEQKTDDMAVSMQKQMLYLFPLMTLVFGYTMPSGVILYWFVFSLFSYIQQLIINKNKKAEVKA
ncbi:membrane protein insertase YidC [Candidatus Microgenomates bacterium]|jgi:YidC/Oxa1 family membrane protein insertase|nr:MAG: membrane protein insertase YidC [Candidatus Microgenomates bacterium]